MLPYPELIEKELHNKKLLECENAIKYRKRLKILTVAYYIYIVFAIVVFSKALKNDSYIIVSLINMLFYAGLSAGLSKVVIKIIMYITALLIPIIWLSAHELLHLIIVKGLYQKKNNICIRIKLSKVTVQPNEPMTKIRFILCLLCPNIMLTIIPLLLMIIFGVFDNFIFLLATANLSYIDINSLISISKAPKNAILYGDYYYLPDQKQEAASATEV